jgi:hypothetical protein
MDNLAGTVIPLPTPFDEREVDEKVFHQVIDFEIDAGADGVMACGSYGQGPVMRADQKPGAPRKQKIKRRLCRSRTRSRKSTPLSPT